MNLQGAAIINQEFYVLPSQARELARKPFLLYFRSFELHMRHVMQAIRDRAEKGHLDVVYHVPLTVHGALHIPYHTVVQYIVEQLKALKYAFRVLEPGNALYISWYDQNMYKLKSSVDDKGKVTAGAVVEDPGTSSSTTRRTPPSQPQPGGRRPAASANRGPPKRRTPKTIPIQ